MGGPKTTLPFRGLAIHLQTFTPYPVGVVWSAKVPGPHEVAHDGQSERLLQTGWKSPQVRSASRMHCSVIESPLTSMHRSVIAQSSLPSQKAFRYKDPVEQVTLASLRGRQV